MAQEQRPFADGFSFKRNENAPDFVVGRLSMKVDEAISFIKENQTNGWINLNIKTARSGNHYVELDTYSQDKAKQTEAPAAKAPAKAKAKPIANDDNEELPF
jgi:hypothetical protein